METTTSATITASPPVSPPKYSRKSPPHLTLHTPDSIPSPTLSDIMDSPKLRTLNNSHLDAFRHAHSHPHSSDEDIFQVSPRTLPVSFRSPNHHDRSISPMGIPVLTIRRTSTPAASPCHSISHHCGTPPQRPHRRLSDASSSPTSPRSSFSSHSSDDDAEPCARHHHRQSVSSTVSIACSSRRGSDHDLYHFEETVETQIPLEAVPPSMLVPLVDRAAEMADLLAHPANAAWVHLVQNVVGRDVWEKRCIPLWTMRGREDVGDREWLRRSERLLKGTTGDGRLWSEFCGMVGWDGSGGLERRGSEDSISSESSWKMNPIAEEEEQGNYNMSTNLKR